MCYNDHNYDVISVKLFGHFLLINVTSMLVCENLFFQDGFQISCAVTVPF